MSWRQKVWTLAPGFFENLGEAIQMREMREHPFHSWESSSKQCLAKELVTIFFGAVSEALFWHYQKAMGFTCLVTLH
jgi:hypothetical protein